jgi:hypothetical protein
VAYFGRITVSANRVRISLAVQPGRGHGGVSLALYPTTTTGRRLLFVTRQPGRCTREFNIQPASYAVVANQGAFRFRFVVFQAKSP